MVKLLIDASLSASSARTPWVAPRVVGFGHKPWVLVVYVEWFFLEKRSTGTELSCVVYSPGEYGARRRIGRRKRRRSSRKRWPRRLPPTRSFCRAGKAPETYGHVFVIRFLTRAHVTASNDRQCRYGHNKTIAIILPGRRRDDLQSDTCWMINRTSRLLRRSRTCLIKSSWLEERERKRASSLPRSNHTVRAKIVIITLYTAACCSIFSNWDIRV